MRPNVVVGVPTTTIGLITGSDVGLANPTMPLIVAPKPCDGLITYNPIP